MWALRHCAVVVAGVAVLSLVAPASAGMVDLGGGWQASWDAALAGLVMVNAVEVRGDALFIQKSAEFKDPPVAGAFSPLEILFEQTDPDAVSHVVIDDEIIANSCGTDWTDFTFGVDAPAVFDPAATANSGGAGPIGFTIAPFTTGVFGAGDTRLDVTGGTVPDGGLWFPGNGITDGQLWINITLDPQGGTSWTLIETPVPEPATLGLLAAGGGLLLARRRR